MKHDEKTMRETEAASPKTADELMEYIEGLVSGEHDYGTCVYAMSMAATAAFNYVASQLGVTGFQAGCADMDILRRTRMLSGPFMLINGENALYPQYDLQRDLREAMDSWRPWLKDEASKKLASDAGEYAHPNVVKHWEMLASYEGATP